MFATKVRAYEGVNQVWRPRGKFHAIRNVRECVRMNPTLLSELTLWELESQWTFEFWKSNFKSQNPLNRRVHYIIAKLLKRRCLKWLAWPIWTLKTQGMAKRKAESQIANFLACKQRATYHWNALDEGYNFALDLISIRGLHTNLWAFKIVGIPILGISRFPLGCPGTKWHLGVGPMAMHKIYYKGEGDGFPKFGPWWVLWVHVCSWHVRASKCSNYTLTNLLFGLCRYVWVIDLLINLLSPHLEGLAHPSTLEVMWAKEHASTFSPSVVFAFGLVVESIKELGGA